tara:strand:+ start:716 stop:883 length:168 start_codon:yes stop_codon:yes gene_type:complete
MAEAKEKRCGMFDAVIDYCEKNNMEIETAAKLVNTKIKKKIAEEARTMNMMKVND